MDFVSLGFLVAKAAGIAWLCVGVWLVVFADYDSETVAVGTYFRAVGYDVERLVGLGLVILQLAVVAYVVMALGLYFPPAIGYVLVLLGVVLFKHFAIRVYHKILRRAR